MGYRSKSYKAQEPERSMHNVSTDMVIRVQNGTKSSLAIPCMYQEVYPAKPAVLHDKDLHDHLGWPTPESPDHSCQAYDFAEEYDPNLEYKRGYVMDNYIDMSAMIPIHLNAEGYNSVLVSVTSDEDTQLIVTGKIDDIDDWVIRISVDASQFAHLDYDITHQFAVFVSTNDGRQDAVAKGTIIVVAGPGASTNG